MSLFVFGFFFFLGFFLIFFSSCLFMAEVPKNREFSDYKRKRNVAQ